MQGVIEQRVQDEVGNGHDRTEPDGSQQRGSVAEYGRGLQHELAHRDGDDGAGGNEGGLLLPGHAERGAHAHRHGAGDDQREQQLAELEALRLVADDRRAEGVDAAARGEEGMGLVQ